MKKIIVVVLAYLIAFHLPNIQAKEKAIKTKISEVESFDMAITRLPSNYKGVDYKKFMALYSSKLKTLEKQEFETTNEYESRISNINLVIDPISLDKKYAFKLPEQTFKYDADSESYALGDFGNYSCSPYANQYMTCPIGYIVKKEEEYRGGNAYGASAIISKTSGTRFVLSIPTDNPVFTNNFTQITRYQTKNLELSIKVPVEVNKAKKIKNKKIGTIFVGSLVEAVKTKGSGDYSNATIDWPYAYYVDEVGIPFNLEKIIVYLEESGEILATY
jgi:CRISPR/Cas system type I-B associated protein Csh2 (Cas7 group RAMP superfamily)